MAHSGEPGARRDTEPLTVASNRLPIRLLRRGEEGWKVETSAGGLVRAMRPVLEHRGGTWVGWTGTSDVPSRQLQELLTSVGEPFRLEPVPLSAAEEDGYYLGFSNRVLWPFLHGMPGLAELRPGDWEAYRRVNLSFARALAAGGNGPVWVHDYHLMLVGEELRRLGSRRPVGFFLHTPFPGPEVFCRVPEWRTLVRGLTRYDRIGFQSEEDRASFLEVAANLPRWSRASREAWSPPPGLARRTGAFPVSIDAAAWARRSEDPDIVRRAAALRADLGGRWLLLGVDRLDYTKGLPWKLRGYARALERRPHLRGRVVLRQLAVPSREEIPAYAALRRRVERLVEAVNRRFATGSWRPVDYRYGCWDDDELVAQYRAADVMLVTPLRDGMNLVGKEFCASSNGAPGVLVLSRFAGAASRLGAGALLVDPRDEDGMARAIECATTMDGPERTRRMRAMQRVLRSEDPRRWAHGLIGELDVAPEVPSLPWHRTRGCRGRHRRHPLAAPPPSAPGAP